MWTDDGFNDYELLDATDGERLERWGGYILVRPDPQVIWREPRRHERWRNADAAYTRGRGGGGRWSQNTPLPASWTVSWRDLTFRVRPTGFKHTGLFPEQAANWAAVTELLRASGSGGGHPLNILNLFAYTGAATLVCARAGANVTHVDAAKGMVAWAKENCTGTGPPLRVRWIVDDCGAFVERELRRGSRYDGVWMDPPSYGRGPNGQVWKLEDSLYGLLQKTAGLLSENARFFFLNTYTAGLAPSVLRYLLEALVVPRFGGRVEADELGLRVGATGLVLPSGATGRWMRS
ncbi:MAG: class I SAM-dependent methyltransferase [Oscillospiraceae bacterium]|jgi:23S rRNA (cytosine1962-C5)-methyltransferase|nr:class I SAM-dependent methyltransferase [Oscillospiraceae bacterium]